MPITHEDPKGYAASYQLPGNPGDSAMNSTQKLIERLKEHRATNGSGSILDHENLILESLIEILSLLAEK